MDFRAEIECAEREVAAAREEYERSMVRLTAAAKRLGILTGVYHGLSALDQTGRPPEENVVVGDHDSTPPRKRARKGEARRRISIMLGNASPEGRTREQLMQLAAQEGDPIAEGTMRRALAQLADQGRAKAVDDVWHTVRQHGLPDNGAAGASHSYPAALSFTTTTPKDDDEAALAE